jgi:hypothetical protein
VPITKIRFSHSPDIHLVRGTAGQSSKPTSIWVTTPDGADTFLSLYLNDHDDVAVKYRPRFKPASESASKSTGFRIEVNRNTGVVTALGGAAPPDSPSNFLLEAVVTKNTGGVDPKTIPPAFLRVYVHPRVERIWLTPNPLSIRARPGSTTEQVRHKFTVRAEFSDGIVADVTDSPELTFTPPSIVDGADIKIPDTASPGDVLDVEVKTSARWGGKSFKAKIQLLEPWENEPTVPLAELIDAQARVWDGTLRPEAVPNILIVACGFPQAAQAGFRDIARSLVHRLRGDRLYQPFGYLATSMNYWRLPIAAEEAGVNVRSEVRLFHHDGRLVALPVPLPEPPPAKLDDWRLSHLIYAVGLPAPSDLKLVDDLDPPHTLPADFNFDMLRERGPFRFRYGELFKRWKKIARPLEPAVDFALVPEWLAHRWLELGDRTFIDDVNAFPAISVGSVPSFGYSPPDLAILDYDDRRGGFDMLDPLLRRVTALPHPTTQSVISLDGSPPENGLGYLWIQNHGESETPVPAAFDNSRFVVALSNSTIGRANARIHTRLELFNPGPSTEVYEGIPVARVAGRNSVTLALDIPSVALLDDPTYEVFTHELAHTLGLGDEYSEQATTYTGDDDSLGRGNVTTEAAVKDMNGVLSLDHIKWNLHRVQKVAIFTRPMIFRGNGLFHCAITKGLKTLFKVGDKVYLRRRETRSPIARAITSPIEFEVKEVHPTNIDDHSDAFNVTLVLQADDPFVSGPSMVVTFDAGSVIYVPVPAPADVVPARKYLTLVPPAAERILASTGLGMTGAACNLQADGAEVQTPVADPAGKLVPAVLPHVVGLYFGGALHACGVMRPAGSCAMRNSRGEPKGNAPVGVSRFCAVCSYILVDYVDPEKHWRIDKDYAGWYPF